ncbi:MAG TPA: hypothetical protein VK783_08585 [Bacteroidia bacterium]|jgi:hypothetical protein|nr:hypothetical protein [Bacteroidia bacterium]
MKKFYTLFLLVLLICGLNNSAIAKSPAKKDTCGCTSCKKKKKCCGNIYTIVFNTSGKIISGMPEKFVDGDGIRFEVLGGYTIPVWNSLDSILKSNSIKKNEIQALLHLLKLDTAKNVYSVPPFFEPGKTMPVEGYKVALDGIGHSCCDSSHNVEYSVCPSDTFYVYHANCKQSFKPAPGRKIIIVNDGGLLNFRLVKENNLHSMLIAYYKQKLKDWTTGTINLDALKGISSTTQSVIKEFKKDSADNMDVFYNKFSLKQLSDIALSISKIPSFPPKQFSNWIKDWIWYTGTPTLAPFKFVDPKDLKDSAASDTSGILAMRVELAALTRKIMRLKGSDYVKELKPEYDSIEKKIDDLEKKIIKTKTAAANNKTSLDKNQQAINDFFHTKTILSNSMMYCTDGCYKNCAHGYDWPIYWMRHYDASNNGIPIGTTEKSEYLESDKVMILYHNLTNNQSVNLTVSTTPITTDNSLFWDGFTGFLAPQLNASSVTPSPSSTFSLTLQSSKSSFSPPSQGNLFTAKYNLPQGSVGFDTVAVDKDMNSFTYKKPDGLAGLGASYKSDNMDSLLLANTCPKLLSELEHVQDTLNKMNYTAEKSHTNIKKQTLQLDSLKKLLSVLKLKGFQKDTDKMNKENARIGVLLKSFKRLIASEQDSLHTYRISLDSIREKLIAIGNKKVNKTISASLDSYQKKLNHLNKSINSFNINNAASTLININNSAHYLQDTINKKAKIADKVLSDINQIMGFSANAKFLLSQKNPLTDLPKATIDTVYHSQQGSLVYTTPTQVSYSATINAPIKKDTAKTPKTATNTNTNPPASMTYSYRVDKRYRIMPFAGVAFCTTRFTNFALNSSGTAPAKLTEVNITSTVVGIRYYFEKTDIRNDNLFWQKHDCRCLLLSRLSFDLGVGIPNPISNIYTGIGIDIVPGFNLNFGALFNGYSYYNFLNSQYVVVHDTYRPGFYIGISTDAAVVMEVAKLLNLSK